MNKKSNIFDRILYLAEIKGFKNVPELASHLGYDSPEKIYRLKRSENAKPSVDILMDFSNKFEDLNLRWLLTGDGEAIFTPNFTANITPNIKTAGEIAPNVAPIIAPKREKSGSFPALNVPKIITVDSEGNENTLFVTAKAAAGYLDGFADPEYRETLQVITLPGLNGQTHRAFEIKGNSMLPTHHSGSIAVGRYVESFNDIRDRRVYIVVTKEDGIVLKRVLNRIKEDNKLILISDNDNKREYPTYSVSPDDVLEIWYWRGSFIRESPEPGTVYTRINDLEGRLAMIETLLSGNKTLSK